jgi:hypothetical protein
MAAASMIASVAVAVKSILRMVYLTVFQAVLGRTPQREYS